MVDDKADYSILAGKDLNFSDFSGNHDNGLDDLSQHILQRSSKAVCHLATPCDPDLRTVVGNIASNIATDLEARLLMVALFKGHAYNTRSKGHVNKPRDTVPANEHLNAYATDILKWTSKHSSTHLGADSAAPLFESFMLFIAHQTKEHFRHGYIGSLKPENCRLILPINNDMEVECTDLYTPGYVDPTDFFSVKCGMFPLSSSMERQKAPAHHLIFADAEIVGHPDDYTEAELRLATKTKALFFNQHNCQFAWGLVVSNHTIHAYVFGPDNIWVSTAMDISGIKGCQAFISLLVNWSLCPIDHLGFDPSIRYVVGSSSGGPYLEVDVHEFDRSTGKVEPQTYYNQWCLGATDRLFGCHARYFATSASLKSMDKPAFLIKDMWMTTCSGSADNVHESSFLNILHAEFDKSREFSDSFVQLISTGSVYISQGDISIADSTATAFAGLPSTVQDAAKGSDNAQDLSSRCVHQHRCTVAKWTGNMISEADSKSQVIVVVADAVVALNAVYIKCNILHGNISDQAIWLQKTAKGVKGVLAEFDYAFYAGANAVEAPELMLFQSIHCLENPRAVRTFLDDWESILYLVCWLGTFGINQAQRTAYAVEYAVRNKSHLPILAWNQGTAADITDQKRLHMSSFAAFEERILDRMQNPFGPLSPLVEDIYRALFLHLGCSGTCPAPNRQVRDVGMPVAVPAPGVERNPLVLRNDYVDTIIANLLGFLARHSDVALAALSADGAEKGSEILALPSAVTSMKHRTDEVPRARPSKRLHS